MHVSTDENAIDLILQNEVCCKCVDADHSGDDRGPRVSRFEMEKVSAYAFHNCSVVTMAWDYNEERNVNLPPSGGPIYPGLFFLVGSMLIELRFHVKKWFL